MSTRLDLFVKPGALQAALGAPDLQVIAVDSPDDFATSHIPGALQITQADFTVGKESTSGLLPDAKTLSAALTATGLRSDAHIVAYDRTGGAAAARLLFTLDAAGHERFSLLDGGLGAWQAEGLPLESGQAEPGHGDFQVTWQNDVIADREWISQHLEDSAVCMLDVRSPDEYTGADVRSARGGHIPGAVNLNWMDFKDDNGQLKQADQVRAELADKNINEASEVVTYCQSHGRSSYAYLVLKALGYPRVRGYPGAWSDWGNSDDLPVEKGN